MNQLRKQTSKPAKVTCMAVLLAVMATFTECSDKTGTVIAEEPSVDCEKEYAKAKDMLRCGVRTPGNSLQQLTVVIQNGEVKRVNPPNPRVCPEDVVRWKYTSRTKDFVLWFVRKDPMYDGCTHLSKNGRLDCTVRDNAEKGCHKYNIVTTDGKDILDPYIIVE